MADILDALDDLVMDQIEENDVKDFLNNTNNMTQSLNYNHHQQHHHHQSHQHNNQLSQQQQQHLHQSQQNNQINLISSPSDKLNKIPQQQQQQQQQRNIQLVLQNHSQQIQQQQQQQQQTIATRLNGVQPLVGTPHVNNRIQTNQNLVPQNAYIIKSNNGQIQLLQTQSPNLNNSIRPQQSLQIQQQQSTQHLQHQQTQQQQQTILRLPVSISNQQTQNLVLLPITSQQQQQQQNNSINNNNNNMNHSSLVNTTPSPAPTPPLHQQQNGGSNGGTPQHQHVNINNNQNNNQNNNNNNNQNNQNTSSNSDNISRLKQFLLTLLKLAQNSLPEKYPIVRNLIQDLVDEKIRPEEFTQRLQIERNPPSASLIPFLKRAIGELRSRFGNQPINIDSFLGLSSPNTNNTANILSTVTTSSQQVIIPNRPIQAQPQQQQLAQRPGQITSNTINQLQMQQQQQQQQQQRPIIVQQPQQQNYHLPSQAKQYPIQPSQQTTIYSSTHQQQPQAQPIVSNQTQSNQQHLIQSNQHIIIKQQQSQSQSQIQIRPQPKIINQLQTTSMTNINSPSQTISVVSQAQQQAQSLSQQNKIQITQQTLQQQQQQQQQKKPLQFNTPSPVVSAVSSPIPSINQTQIKTQRIEDDDELSDVTAMVGIDLAAEKKTLLASAQQNTQQQAEQLRTCKEDKFLNVNILNKKLADMAKKFKLDDVSHDVATILSHATQEYLRNIIEKLNIITQHRLDLSVRTNDSYEPTNDVKNQLKFIEELDKIEKKKKDDAEREKLMKAAKSRTKGEDQELKNLKQKAKELVQAESDEMRRQDANKTALAAIGPRKKRKLEESTSSTSLVQRQILRPKIKRVSLRDMIQFMENEKEFRRSTLLFKALNK